MTDREEKVQTLKDFLAGKKLESRKVVFMTEQSKGIYKDNDTGKVWNDTELVDFPNRENTHFVFFMDFSGKSTGSKVLNDTKVYKGIDPNKV
jgi:hypothetical protein